MRENEDIEDFEVMVALPCCVRHSSLEIFMSISIRLETKVEELGDFSRFERLEISAYYRTIEREDNMH